MKGIETVKALSNGLLLYSPELDCQYIKMVDGKIVDEEDALIDYSLNFILSVEFEAISPLSRHNVFISMLEGNEVKAVNSGRVYAIANGRIIYGLDKSLLWHDKDTIGYLKDDLINDFIVEVKEYF